MRATCWSAPRRVSPRLASLPALLPSSCCAQLGIEVASHVIRVGRVDLERDATWEEIAALAGKEEVVLSCVDAATEARMKEEVEAATRADDTVNGVFEVIAHGVPAGLGSYANWDDRLDGQLAWAVMSLQAVKAVEIGRGVEAAASFRLAGSRSHSLRGRKSSRPAHAIYAPAQ